MNALITGGGGFIGSAIARELKKMGFTITIFCRGDYPELKSMGAIVKRGDISDREAVSDACEKIDIVFHVAAKAGIWGSYRDYFNINVRGTENIVNACKKNRIKWLVFTSSASVVFDGNEIRGGDESLPYPRSPLSYYTGTKALAEICVLNADSESLRTIAIRPHIVIGPGDNHLLPRILERAGKGKLRQVGDGRNVVDLTFIDNVVKAHVCAARAIMERPDVSGKPYFISNGEPVLLWDVINMILKGAGMGPVRSSIPAVRAYSFSLIAEATYRILNIGREPILTKFLVHELSKSHWFNINSARNLLDYCPGISNKESITRTIAWLQKK
jgi:nucleoside-diphosphate-sugar epimerase